MLGLCLQLGVAALAVLPAALVTAILRRNAASDHPKTLCAGVMTRVRVGKVAPPHYYGSFSRMRQVPEKTDPHSSGNLWDIVPLPKKQQHWVRMRWSTRWTIPSYGRHRSPRGRLEERVVAKAVIFVIDVAVEVSEIRLRKVAWVRTLWY